MNVSLHTLGAVLLAENAGAGASDGGASLFLPIVIMIAVFYLMVLRPSSKERKQHAAMLQALKRGDEIVTTGGIVGTIADMADSIVTIEISRNVKVRMLRSAIAKKYEEPAKADAKEKDKDKDKEKS